MAPAGLAQFPVRMLDEVTEKTKTRQVLKELNRLVPGRRPISENTREHLAEKNSETICLERPAPGELGTRWRGR